MARTTLFSTSNQKGGRRAASISSGGKIGMGGKFITREQRRGQLRAALGIKG